MARFPGIQGAARRSRLARSTQADLPGRFPGIRFAGALSLALLWLGCDRPRATPAPASSAAVPASPAAGLPSASASVASGSASASVSAASGSSSTTAGGPAPLPSIRSRCCRLDRTEGFFGPEKGIHARFSGDVLQRNDGERLLFPHDLVSDTKELYQFAKSSGKSLYQERRLRIVGEVAQLVSIEIDERGETGANAPFFHSRCATLDTRKKRLLTVEEALPGQGKALLEEAKRRFEGAPGRDRFRFVSGSFAVTETELRFCCAARDDRQPTPRLDVSVALDPAGRKLVSAAPGAAVR